MIIGIILSTIIGLVVIGIFFPIPLSDREQTRYGSRPWMTMTIIGVNCLIFFLWLAPDIYDNYNTTAQFNAWLRHFAYGFNPRLIREHRGVGAFSTFTSMFMHVDTSHLFGNMIFLWAFGTRVEDAAGPWRYLIFYLTAGMIAHVGFVFFGQSTIAVEVGYTVGASGAISGVLGAYLILFYRERVTFWWGVGSALRLPLTFVRNMFSNRWHKLWRWTVSLPAWTILLLFIAKDSLPSLQTIQGQRDLTGVNYLGHFAGYLAGLSVFLFVRKDLLMRYIQGRAL